MSVVDNVDWRTIAMDFQFERDLARKAVDELKQERAALLEQMDKLYARCLAYSAADKEQGASK